MKINRIILCAATLLVLCACGSKDEDAVVVLSPQTVTLKKGETAKLEVAGVPGAEWKSDEMFVATVLSGTVTGEHVGKTTIRATYKNSTATCEVIVEPKYDLLPRPILQFGATPAQIRALEPGTFIEGRQATGFYLESYDRGGRKLEYHFKDDKLTDASQREYALSFIKATPALQERFQFVRSVDATSHLYYHPVDNYYVIVYTSSGCSIVYLPEFD